MSLFGDELKRLMALNGFTQQRLAASCKISQTFVGKLTRVENPRLGADVLYALCDALGVECGHFRPFIAPHSPPPAPPAAPASPRKRRGKA